MLYEVSRRFNVDPHTVRRCRVLTAGSYLILQAMLIKSMCQNHASEAGASKRVYAAVSLCWDSTEQVLALGLDKSLALNQQRTSWHILVSSSQVLNGVVPPGAKLCGP